MTADDLNDLCAECGLPATRSDSITVIGGAHVHTSHTNDPQSRYYQKH